MRLGTGEDHGLPLLHRALLDQPLLCHRRHQLSHQPGWTITGTGTALEVRHPDGSVKVSKPPGARAPRAGTIGREPALGDALVESSVQPAQLQLG